MKAQTRFLLLLQIEGFSAGLRHDPSSAAHAEELITCLLEALADRADARLELHEVLGEGLYFSADMAALSAPELLAEALDLGRAFQAEVTAQREAHDCSCGACCALGGLSLRMVLHSGEVALKQVRQFRKPAGEPVILAHRLLHHPLPAPAGLVLTAEYAAQAGLAGQGALHVLAPEGLGPVPVVLMPLPREMPPRAGAAMEPPTAPQPPAVPQGDRLMGWWPRALASH